MAFHFNPGKRGSARKPSVPSPVSGVGREKCPYNPHHEVSSDKMEAHLDRCRREYKCSGKELTYFSCKYNYRHQIPVQELLYHESRCKDGEYVPTYLLNVALEASPDGEKLEPLEPSKEELDRMYEGLYIDTFIGSASFGKPIPFSKIPPAGYIDPKLVDEWNQVVPDKKDLGMEEKPAEVQPSTSTEGVINEEDEGSEEEWNEGDRPMFSYMQNFLYPTKPLTMFPPMLKTKSQRREFVKWNTRWKDSIEKDGQEDEAEEVPMGVLKIPAAFSISAEEIAHEPLQPVKKAKLVKQEVVVDKSQGAVGGLASLPREIIIPVEDIVFDPTNPRAKVQASEKEVVIKEMKKVGDGEATSEVKVATWADEMALEPIVEGSGSVLIPQDIEEDKEEKQKELSNAKVEDTANRQEVSGEQEKKKEEEEPKSKLEESEKVIEKMEKVGDEATSKVEIAASTEEMAMEPIVSAPILQEIKEVKEEGPSLEEIPKSDEIEKELSVEKVDDTSHLDETSGEESEKKEEGEPKLERSEKVDGEASLEMTEVTREITIPVEDIVFDSTSPHKKIQSSEKEVIIKEEKVGDGEATSEMGVLAAAEEKALEPIREGSGSAPIPQEIEERKDESQSLEEMPKSDEIEKEISEEKEEDISNLEEVSGEQEKKEEEEPKLEESKTVVGQVENEMSDTNSAPIDSLKTETDDGEGQGTSQEDSENSLEVEAPAPVSISDESEKPEETLEVVRIPPIRMSVSRGAWGPVYWQNLESGAGKDENESLPISNEEKDKEVGNDSSAILEGEKEDPISVETPKTVEENAEGPQEKTRSSVERGESTLEELEKDFVQRVIDVVSEFLTPNLEAESVGGEEQKSRYEESGGIKEIEVSDEATGSGEVKDEEEIESSPADEETEAQVPEGIKVEKVEDEKLNENLQHEAQQAAKPVSPEADKASVVKVDEDSVIIEIETEAVVKGSEPATPEQVEAATTCQPIPEVSGAKFDDVGLVPISNGEKLEANEDKSPTLGNGKECSSLEVKPEAYAEITEDQREKKKSTLEEAKQLKLEETEMSVGQVENVSEPCNPLMKLESDEGEKQTPSHDAPGGKQETVVADEAKESAEGTVAQLPEVIQAKKMEERSNDNCQAGIESASSKEVTAAVEAVVEVLRVKEDSVVIEIEHEIVVKESESENADEVEPTILPPQPFQEVSVSKAESVEAEPIISSKEPPEIEAETAVKESESGDAAEVEATTISFAEGVETGPITSSQEPKETTPEILAPESAFTVPEPEQGVTESKAESIIPPPPGDKEDPTSDELLQETTTAVPQVAPEISEAETTERDQSEPLIEEESITSSEQSLQISPENLGEDAVPVQAEPTPAHEAPAPSSELKVIIVGKKEMKGKIKKDAFTQTDLGDE